MAQALALTTQASLLQLLRQAGVLIGLAASVALGLYVVLWARTPEYSVLYSDLAERDLSQVIDTLHSSDIPYRLDQRSGAILVAVDQVHDARLKLAGAGLPRNAAMGFEMLQEEQGFGTSQFLEQARYQRAIEGELSRSIAHINNVRSARVHLALPKHSAFARSKRDPTASVIVDLYNGRRLEPHQVGAIVHMVSASVAGLSTAQVTVIDQQGNLLTDDNRGGDDLVLTARRFEYTRTLEQSYIDRVEAILMPLVGADGVRAQITADVDFTTSEQTRESFNPDLPAVRSESTLEEERHGGDMGGVPGALSNEPPVAATAPEQTAAAAGAPPAGTAPATAPAIPANKRNQATRNYELDRTISHTRPAVGSIRRLSVAVVVRNPVMTAATGEGVAPAGEAPAAAASAGLDAAQIERMTNLVKEAIGFDAARGDSVSVTSADFLAPPALEPLPEPAIWERAWVWSVGKQILAGLFVLLALFGVIRPAVKALMARPLQTTGDGDAGVLAIAGGAGAPALTGGAGGGTMSVPALPNMQRQIPGQPLLVASDVDPNIDNVKQFVTNDPRVAAQVIRGWVGE